MQSKKATRIYCFFSFSAGIGIVAAILFYAGRHQLIEIISSTSLDMLAAALLVYTSSWCFRTWRLLRFTSREQKEISLIKLFKIQISGFALNAILPLKLGDALPVIGLKNEGISIGKSTAIVVQTRVLDLLAVLTIIFPVIFLYLGKNMLGWMWKTFFFFVLISVIAFGFVVITRYRNIFPVFKFLRKKTHQTFVLLFLEKLEDVYDGYIELAADKRLLIDTFSLSILIWLLEGLTGYMMAVATGVHLSFFYVLLAVAFANLGKSGPTTPGGIGVYETIMAAILTLSGISFENAVVIAFLDHMGKKAFTLGTGVPAILDIFGLNWQKRLRQWKTTGS